MEAVEQHEQKVIAYALERLEEIPGVKVFGPEAQRKGGVAAFVLDDLHAHDISQVLDISGIAVRAGHHCAQPVMLRFGLSATVRASFGLYNTHQEIDALVAGLHKARECTMNIPDGEASGRPAAAMSGLCRLQPSVVTASSSLSASADFRPNSRDMKMPTS